AKKILMWASIYHDAPRDGLETIANCNQRTFSALPARGRSCDSDYMANCGRRQLTCQAIDEHRCVEDNHLGFSSRVDRPPDRRARRISFNSASTSRWGRPGITAIMVSKIFRRFWISLSLKRSMRP